MDSEKTSIDDSLFEKATNGNIESIEIMFRDFISLEENILYCNYFGMSGLWGFGGHTWGCLTNKRVAVLELEPFRKMLYKDAFHEKIDYGIIYQPHYLGVLIFLLTISSLWMSILFPIFAVSIDGLMKFFRHYIHYNYNSKDNISMLIISILTGFSLPFVWHASIRGYYRFVKHGLIYKIRRDGLYLFSRRKHMSRVIELHKYSMLAKANCE